MYTVYVLQDENGKVYKGCNNNLVRRFREHNKCNGSRTTSEMNGLKIVYIEEYETFKEARSREVYLKTAAGRRFLKLNMRL